MSQALSPMEEVERALDDLESVEQRLMHLQSQLVSSHRLATLGVMAASLAHEFNNLLTPIINYCQMAQRKPDDLALVQKAISRSLAAAQRSAQISQSVLGFARGDTGETAGVAGVFEEVLACMARPLDRDGITLTTEIGPDCRVRMNATHLQQVLLNLTLNARQAMTRGGRLTLKTNAISQRIHIDMADTGPGIRPDIQTRLFNPFVTARSDQPQGTGLGLAISRDLVQQAGGRLELIKTSATGTLFRVDLPMASA